MDGNDAAPDVAVMTANARARAPTTDEHADADDGDDAHSVDLPVRSEHGTDEEEDDGSSDNEREHEGNVALAALDEVYQSLPLNPDEGAFARQTLGRHCAPCICL